jgi:hypothetical protein
LQFVDRSFESKLVQENTEFLKQSWANMVEEEEDIEEVSDNPQQPPFIVVQAKTVKKKHAQKSNSQETLWNQKWIHGSF